MNSGVGSLTPRHHVVHQTFRSMGFVSVVIVSVPFAAGYEVTGGQLSPMGTDTPSRRAKSRTTRVARFLMGRPHEASTPTRRAEEESDG